jgi:amino acid adenylation domain-containing protein
MSAQTALHQYLDDSARVRGDCVAVEDPGIGRIDHRGLAELSDRLRDRLRHMGVRPGDRVGIYLRKSIDAVASIFGILKVGAAYVPVDPGAPAERNAYILNDCAARAVVVERDLAKGLEDEIARLGGAAPALLVLDGTHAGASLREALAREERDAPAPRSESVVPTADALAYILYTSGSTGRPKGVMLSHRNATSFVDWCSSVFEPRPGDRFSSHAPFHFDLSILDLYVAIKHGATVVLVGAEIGKDPARLASLIAEERITIWYSAPSILSLLAQFGELGSRDTSALRTVLFAGEVFPVKHLRALKQLLPAPVYYNLYGPTETNVCTYHPIPEEIPAERTQPYPIGRVCSHLRAKVVDEKGHEVEHGQQGELCVAGPGVMQGYWNLPEQNARTFLPDPEGERWYRTGDIVTEDSHGAYTYLGRRDRMVKRRGYRVELGEIEACLYRHPDIVEAAVIALPDDDAGVRIKAFVASREGKRPSLIALKRFCSEHLPLYMVPDLFSFPSALPKTSTDKTDYQKLKELA